MIMYVEFKDSSVLKRVQLHKLDKGRRFKSTFTLVSNLCMSVVPEEPKTPCTPCPAFDGSL